MSERVALVPEAVDTELIRAAIREERKLDIRYSDESGSNSSRRVLPLAVIY